MESIAIPRDSSAAIWRELAIEVVEEEALRRDWGLKEARTVLKAEAEESRESPAMIVVLIW
jgi:hypothetical protein